MTVDVRCVLWCSGSGNGGSSSGSGSSTEQQTEQRRQQQRRQQQHSTAGGNSGGSSSGSSSSTAQRAGTAAAERQQQPRRRTRPCQTQHAQRSAAASPVHEQGPDADGTLHPPVLALARLGDAQVQGVVPPPRVLLLRKQAVRLGGRRYRGRRYRLGGGPSVSERKEASGLGAAPAPAEREPRRAALFHPPPPTTTAHHHRPPPLPASPHCAPCALSPKSQTNNAKKPRTCTMTSGFEAFMEKRKLW